MRRSRRLWIALTLLTVLVIAGTISLCAPLIACSSCSGAGKITVLGSHPEAMGSQSTTGTLIDVACPTCDGKARVTLYHKMMWVPPALSSR